jgi:DNA (cytosine-5)-methyltransferase 1
MDASGTRTGAVGDANRLRGRNIGFRSLMKIEHVIGETYFYSKMLAGRRWSFGSVISRGVARSPADFPSSLEFRWKAPKFLCVTVMAWALEFTPALSYDWCEMRKRPRAGAKSTITQPVVAGLFAGIGGLELGFERCGGKTALLCEIDEAAQRVLAKRFPGVPIVPDIRELVRLPIEVNVVTAGFPCQDLSMAGSKSGISGSMSSLVGYLFDLLSKRRVEWVVIENVYFMLQLDRGRAIATIADRLEHLGYRWAYRVIDTISFLPQRRRRVFIVASLSHDPRGVLFDSEDLSNTTSGSDPSRTDVPLGFYWTEGRSGVGIVQNAIPPLKAGSTIGIRSVPAILLPDGRLGMPSLADCERLQGFSAGGTAAARTDNKSRDGRWRLVGNAVSVPVACWIAKRLVALRPLGVEPEVVPIRRGNSWVTAAFNIDGARMGFRAGALVGSRSTPDLLDVIRDELQPLSARAINGFLSRAKEGGLKFPPGFLCRIATCLQERKQLEKNADLQ